MSLGSANVSVSRSKDQSCNLDTWGRTSQGLSRLTNNDSSCTYADRLKYFLNEFVSHCQATLVLRRNIIVKTSSLRLS
ncbi:hypothetical protein ACSQ67_001973 [Phaseolus vulgaris]